MSTFPTRATEQSSVTPGSAAGFSSKGGRRRPFDPQRFSRLEPLALRARFVMEGFLDGVHASPFHGPSVEFSEYRDYQQGDDLRRVDWRLFARRDRLAVKRYEQETNARCYLMMDTSASMDYRGTAAWGSKLAAARALAAALAWTLLRQGDAIGLVARQGDQTVFLPPSRVRSRLGEILGRLEELHTTPPAKQYDVADEGRLAALLTAGSRHLRRRSLIFLFSDLLDPSSEVQRSLERLRFEGHDCRVLQILDRDELELPFADGTVLEDLETGTRRQVGEKARRRYLSRLHAFLDEWRGLLRRLEMPHCLATTDADPSLALTRLLFPSAAGRHTASAGRGSANHGSASHGSASHGSASSHSGRQR